MHILWREYGGVGYTVYGLAEMNLQSCFSAIPSFSDGWRRNVSTRGRFVGYNGEADFWNMLNIEVPQSGTNQ